MNLDRELRDLERMGIDWRVVASQWDREDEGARARIKSSVAHMYHVVLRNAEGKAVLCYDINRDQYEYRFGNAWVRIPGMQIPPEVEVTLPEFFQMLRGTYFAPDGTPFKHCRLKEK